MPLNMFQLLDGALKDDLLWNVDRSSPTDKINDFVLRSKVLIFFYEYTDCNVDDSCHNAL